MNSQGKRTPNLTVIAAVSDGHRIVSYLNGPEKALMKQEQRTIEARKAAAAIALSGERV